MAVERTSARSKLDIYMRPGAAYYRELLKLVEELDLGENVSSMIRYT